MDDGTQKKLKKKFFNRNMFFPDNKIQKLIFSEIRKSVLCFCYGWYVVTIVEATQDLAQCRCLNSIYQTIDFILHQSL